jgi:hypothetical protein
MHPENNISSGYSPSESLVTTLTAAPEMERTCLKTFKGLKNTIDIAFCP